MKKKVVSILLVAAMTAGLVAGCGTNTAGNADNSTPSSEAGAGGEVLSDVEEGKVINIYCWNDEFSTRVNAIYSEVASVSDD